ncbi:RNA 3'-terminal phosphate cyclase [Candidatus Woesearchaeota archaeon]|nr:RNA 3'-terminal phosphate cyclase [Candidatus Woesearchaeota archaeon]
MTNLIQLDGTSGEGGGSLVRTALAISTITGKGFSVTDIRKGRSEPGLKAQHLQSVLALQKMCHAEVSGAALGSMNLTYVPGSIQGGTYTVDIGTAGSVTLALQSLLLPCCFADAPLQIELSGGTDVPWSPTFDYFHYVCLPYYSRFATIECSLLKRGFYPKGGGNVLIHIIPRHNRRYFSSFEDFLRALQQSYQPFDLTLPVQVQMVQGNSLASTHLQAAQVAERQGTAAQLVLEKNLSVPINIQASYHQSLSPGSSITLWTESQQGSLGSDALGKQKTPAEVVGENAARQLLYEIEMHAGVDVHLADQLLMLMALLPGSKLKTSAVTNHMITNNYVLEKFLPVTMEVHDPVIQVNAIQEKPDRATEVSEQSSHLR